MARLPESTNSVQRWSRRHWDGTVVLCLASNHRRKQHTHSNHDS